MLDQLEGFLEYKDISGLYKWPQRADHAWRYALCSLQDPFASVLSSKIEELEKMQEKSSAAEREVAKAKKKQLREVQK